MSVIDFTCDFTADYNSITKKWFDDSLRLAIRDAKEAFKQSQGFTAIIVTAEIASQLREHSKQLPPEPHLGLHSPIAFHGIPIHERDTLEECRLLAAELTKAGESVLLASPQL